MRTTTLLVALALVPRAAASDFDDAVDYVEKAWKAERVRIPFLGLGLLLASSLGAPAGARDFRIAVFENASPSHAAAPALELSEGWRPMVRTRVRTGRDQALVFVRDEGSWTRIIVLKRDGEDAAVVQCRIRPDRLARFLGHYDRDAD